MDWKSNEISTQDIREMDMVNYLSGLGFEPARPSRNGVDFYYLSPLRNENDPSFHINRKINRWFDHGLRKGGDLIDFGTQFYKCSTGEFLEQVASAVVDLQHWKLQAVTDEMPKEKEQRITVLSEKKLYAYPLINYLHERHIPKAIADQYCCEVSYELDGRNYFGIGFKNDAGGFEIRNAIVKQCSAPKDITTIRNGSKEVHVFEGFIDFLSWKTLHQQDNCVDPDFVVLNGAAFFEKARPVMEQYEMIRLWLDRDTTGIEYTKYALSLHKGYRDESGLYSKHKDLNDWLCHKGVVVEKHLRQKLRP